MSTTTGRGPAAHPLRGLPHLPVASSTSAGLPLAALAVLGALAARPPRPTAPSPGVPR